MIDFQVEVLFEPLLYDVQVLVVFAQWERSEHVLCVGADDCHEVRYLNLRTFLL